MATTKKLSRNLYSVHPSVAYAQSVIANMKSKTGRSIDEWVELVEKQGPSGESQCAAWLKSKYGLGTNYAGWIAASSAGTAQDWLDPKKYLAEAARYVEALYAGPKAALRPIHDALLACAFELSRDIQVCPCQTMVPLFREHVIAQIKPSTKTRVDFGLALGKYAGKLPARLIDTGGAAKKDRITHRIELTDAAQIDEFVARWLRTAYELDG